MEKRQLHLLGPVRIDLAKLPQREGKKETADFPRFRSKRTMALLAYLATERRAIAREYLAVLFWPDEPLSDGRSNLRRELHNLKDILPDCWNLTRRTVEYIGTENTNVDTHIILELEAKGRWQEAVEMLTGDFTEGLYLDDNPEFETWQFAQRENWRERTERIYSQIIEEHEIYGRYKEALELTRRLLGISPWNEEAHRRAMRLLVWSGQDNEAVRQFTLCEKTLREELDVEPSEETEMLYQSIKNSELPPPPRIPAFFIEEGPQADIPPLIFVGREEEFAQLDEYLTQTLEGESQVVFITGNPGSGKTFLMKAFTQRCIEKHPDVLIVRGNCYPYSGTGDPYLPFRDVMGMLVGEVESMWDVGAISQAHASRLWKAVPRVITNLLDYGPHVLDVFIQQSSLRSRLETASQPSAPWVPQLKEHLEHPRGKSQEVDQSNLFHQFTNVIREIANEYPLILMLEDIQWADADSVDLLFHLGRRLSALNSPVMILCSYRPVEVEIGRRGERHPLSKILNELKIIYGENTIDLGKVAVAQRRAFVDDFLDTEPNCFTEEFRRALFKRTNGHPLFTVELLRAMQERGDLVKEGKKGWIESDSLKWEHHPPRVEAVIQERIEQTNPACQEILTVASVEGEVFTAQVISEVLGNVELPVIEMLSTELSRRHKLVREEGIVASKQGRVSRFRFNHALFQEHLYRKIGLSERQMIHERIASAIKIYYPDDYAALAHHYGEARIKDQALKYYTLAGKKALDVFAYKEAEDHLRSAIEISEDEEEKANLLAELGEAYYGQSLFYEAIDAWQEGIKLYREYNNYDLMAWLYARSGRATWDMGDSAGSVSMCEQGLKELESAPEGDGIANLMNQTARAYRFNHMLEKFMDITPRAYDMAMRVGAPHARVLAMLNRSVSMLYSKRESLEEVIISFKKAVELAESAGIHNQLSRGLTALGNMTSGNDPHKGLNYYHQAMDISRRTGSVTGEMVNTVNIVLTNLFLGDLKEAKHQIDALRNRLDGVFSGEMGYLRVQYLEGILLGFQGYHEKAVKIITPIWKKAEESNIPQWVGFLGSVLGDFCLELGRASEAGEFILAAVDDVSEALEGKITPRVLMVIKSIQEGNLEEANTWLNEPEKLIDKNKIKHQREHLKWVHAKACLLAAEKNFGQAWEWFDDAIQVAGEIGFQWLKTRFKLSWAEAHLARGEEGDQAKGLAMLKEVREEYKDMGADGWDKRVGKRIREVEKASA